MNTLAFGLIGLWVASLLLFAVLIYAAPGMDDDGQITTPGRRLLPLRAKRRSQPKQDPAAAPKPQGLAPVKPSRS